MLNFPNFCKHRIWFFILSFALVGYISLATDLLQYENFMSEAIDNEACRVDKLAFLKLHKCASTTVQNIILRYAYFHEKNIVLPKGKSNYLGQPDVFSVRMVEGTPWHKLGYNFFTLHTRWNHGAVSKLLGNDTKYVTMMRNPVDVFESFYSYQHMEQFYNVSLDKFIENLENDRHFRLNVANKRMHGFVGRNQMVWDFGLKPKFFESDEAVDKLIEFIDTNFDLVMISERFEESIVLFKHLTCWTYDEVSYLKLNARLDSRKVSLTDKQRSVLSNWLGADTKLYKFFEKKFERSVKAFGRKRMEKELKTLLEVNNEVEKRCVEKVVTNKDSNGTEKWYSDTVFFYKVKDNSSDPACRLYGIKENTFISELQKIQLSRYRVWERNERLKSSNESVEYGTS